MDESGIEYNYQHRNLMFPRLQRTISCGIAICMDIQFKDFDLSLKHTRYCADYQIKNGTQLCIFIANWGKPEKGDEGPQLATKMQDMWIESMRKIVD